MPVDLLVFGGAIIHTLELLGAQNLAIVIDCTKRGARGEVAKINGSSIGVINRWVLVGYQVQTKVTKLGDSSADYSHGTSCKVPSWEELVEAKSASCVNY